MASYRDVVVGLDIGTTKICAIVGEVTPSGIHVVGFGSHPSTGLRKGMVINIEATVESITKAIEQAERQSGIEINHVVTGIAGGHIKSFNSTGLVAIKDQEIKKSDVDRVIEAAKAVAIPMDREVIHAIAQEFTVDDQSGIKDPVGMSGVRLECKVHMVTAAVTSAQNIVKCCNRAGLNVSEIVLEPIASAEACLTADEKELGVCIVDIGGGTTDIAIIAGGSLVYTSVIAVGGHHLTNDVAVGLRTPHQEAEIIKVRHGTALASMVAPDETIEVPSVGGRKSRTIPRAVLADILEPRFEEILSLVRREIIKSGLQDKIACGVVLTGGASLLMNSVEAAERILDMPAKIGVPVSISGLVDIVNSPMYATGVGLVRYGSKNPTKAKFPVRHKEDLFHRVQNTFVSWVKEMF